MRECNQAGVNLIKSFESCRLTAYQDGNGIWTIGWGHTGTDVLEGLQWTQDQADWQFHLDLIQRAETPVNAYVRTSITDNQFAALCSLCFNIGGGNFHSSTVMKLINADSLDGVPAAIMMWNKVAGSVSPGLVRRRTSEVQLWNAPDEAVS